MEQNKTEIKESLDSMGLSWEERPIESTLAAFMEQCGYRAYPILVNVSALEMIQADLGVIATPVNTSSNNGVYIFCVLRDHSLALITVIPSTISKGPMITRTVGAITNAIESLTLPPLTTFDLVMIVGQVLQNTAMKTILTGTGILEAKKQEFLTMYLPKFLANVAMYETGATDKEGKPLINEEIVDMEPLQLRQLLMEGGMPECLQKHIEPSDSQP